MTAVAKLLREPPDAFRLAMGGLHQDVDIVRENRTRAQYCAGFVHPKDRAALSAYLSALLSDERVLSADLKGLINRYDTDFKFRRSSDAREFLVEMRDVLVAGAK
jgi:hypothetical protein